MLNKDGNILQPKGLSQWNVIIRLWGFKICMCKQASYNKTNIKEQMKVVLKKTRCQVSGEVEFGNFGVKGYSKFEVCDPCSFLMLLI